MLKIHGCGKEKHNFQILIVKHVGTRSIFDEHKAISFVGRKAHIQRVLVHGRRDQDHERNTVCENPESFKGAEAASQQSRYLNCIFKSGYDLC